MLVAARIIVILYIVIGIATVLIMNKFIIKMVNDKGSEYSFNIRFLIVCVLSMIVGVCWPWFVKVHVNKKSNKEDTE